MNKVLWITGAGKGIGRAVALKYASEGWVVAVSSRTEKDLLKLKDESKFLSNTDLIHCFPMDITSKESYQETYNIIKSQFSIPTQIIFNAGTHLPSPIQKFSSKLHQNLIDINYIGTVYGIETVLPDLLSKNNGHIGIVASVAGYRGLPKSSAYGASKAALINLCESLNIELDNKNIFISLINPGFVKTPLTDKNKFPMPFLISADEAASKIYKGMEDKKFEITFPRFFVFLLKFLRVIPYSMYFKIIKKYTNV